MRLNKLHYDPLKKHTFFSVSVAGIFLPAWLAAEFWGALCP
jgi:hypothetical protein